MSNITKTTAITTSKQSSHSRADINDLNVNVGLPKIGSNNGQLESIVDSRLEDSYKDAVPQKPKGMRLPSEESSSTKNDNKLAHQKVVIPLKSSSVGGQSTKQLSHEGQ